MTLSSTLIDWCRELHQHPGLSLQEEATTVRIHAWLHVADVDILPFEPKTDLVTEIGQGEDAITLRADIDALPIEKSVNVSFCSPAPGVVYAYGHNVHTSVMLNAALLLKRQEITLPGRVRTLFQPAEESFGGAKMLIHVGVL